MRTLLAAFLALWCLAVPGDAQEALSEPDRNFLVEYLLRTQRMFHDEISGLTDEQWRFKPLPQRWSVAECAEHIVLAERWLMSQFREAYAKTPEPAYIFHWRKPKPRPEDFQPVPRGERANAYRDRIARETDRSNVDPGRPPEGDPPEASLVPAFRYATPEEAVAALDATRSETVEFVRRTKLDLYNNYVYPGTSTLLLDGFEYLLRVPAHAERHIAQMQDVKAHARFPSAQPRR